MKKQAISLALSLAILIISFSSCSKSTCTDVSYNAQITVSAGDVFCFPDGAQLEVLALNNEFCPFLALCVWEGEMTLDVTWIDAAGTMTTGVIGSSSGNYSDKNLPETAFFSEPHLVIEFEEEPSASNPSPIILSVDLMVVE